MSSQVRPRWEAVRDVAGRKVTVRCNRLGSWSVVRSWADGPPAEWASATGPIGILVSRVVEGDVTAWEELATVVFPASGEDGDDSLPAVQQG